MALLMSWVTLYEQLLVLQKLKCSINISLRGCPEISTFSTYEITSHKRGEGVAKSVDNLITFCSILIVEKMHKPV